MDPVSLTVGAVGAVLGIFNAVKTHYRDKVSVKVIFKVYRNGRNGRIMSRDKVASGDNWDGVAIEVVNDGFLPVTIDEVGLVLNNATKVTLCKPEFLSDQHLPCRLEARTAVTAFVAEQADGDITLNGTPGALYAYAGTACGRMFKGKSPALKSLIRIGNKTAKRLEPKAGG